MATKVKVLIDAARQTLLEVDATGVRWTIDELIGYLNDANRFLVEIEPETFTDNSELICVHGAKQELPSNLVTLVKVTRNLDGNLTPINLMDMEMLSIVRSGWLGEPASIEQEFYMYDDRDPRHFFVYPPATSESVIEIVGTIEPQTYSERDYTENTLLLHTNDRYYPALLNYVLYRSFDKDSDDGGNFNRSQTYLQAAYNALGIKMQNGMRVSPNNN